MNDTSNRSLRALWAVASLLVASVAVQAQTIGESRRLSTRQELEKAVAISEQAAASAGESRLRAQHQAEAAQLRLRLQMGDFAAGDRILITVYGDSVLSDTFTVRADRMLRLPGIPDVPLLGVLAAELEPHLTKSLSVYYKEPRVDATPLVRVSVQGAIGRPGFYVIPVDQALPDLIMAAGGPGGTSDLDRATVRRGSTTVLDAKAMQLALRQGKTIGDVSMREGDVLLVPDKTSRWNAQTIFGALGAVTGVVWALRWGLRW
jgi:protein involved in polysaccharide export with SLBB domain